MQSDPAVICGRCNCQLSELTTAFSLAVPDGILTVCELCLLLAHSQALVAPARLGAEERAIITEELRPTVIVLHECALRHAASSAPAGGRQGQSES